MTRQDYQIRIAVYFTVEVGAESAEDAENSVEVITRSVFRNNYGRADDIDFEIIKTERRGQ